jgi:hypothetical protein
LSRSADNQIATSLDAEDGKVKKWGSKEQERDSEEKERAESSSRGVLIPFFKLQPLAFSPTFAQKTRKIQESAVQLISP